jgi:hypothetical protein
MRSPLVNGRFGCSDTLFFVKYCRCFRCATYMSNGGYVAYTDGHGRAAYMSGSFLHCRFPKSFGRIPFDNTVMAENTIAEWFVIDEPEDRGRCMYPRCKRRSNAVREHVETREEGKVLIQREYCLEHAFELGYRTSTANVAQHFE